MTDEADFSRTIPRKARSATDCRFTSNNTNTTIITAANIVLSLKNDWHFGYLGIKNVDRPL